MAGAKVQHLLLCASVAALLCASVAALLILPSCHASRTTGTRNLLSSPSASEDDREVPSNDTDQGGPTCAREKGKEWARFQVQEVGIDYTPPEANPDPGNPSPIGD